MTQNEILKQLKPLLQPLLHKEGWKNQDEIEKRGRAILALFEGKKMWHDVFKILEKEFEWDDECNYHNSHPNFDFIGYKIIKLIDSGALDI